MKNLMEKIERVNVNSYYEANIKDFAQIYNHSSNECLLMMNSFTFGYMQGHKAALAEMKKKARAK